MADQAYFDLHLHMLPGVDDGAVDLDEAAEMAEALIACGYSGAAVTPHLRLGMFDNDPAELRAEASRLAEGFRERGIVFEVLPGAEHYLDVEVLEDILEGGGLPLGGQGSVYLVEVPMEYPIMGLLDQVFRMRLKGITPLFAHPERCKTFADVDLARRVVEGGGHLQLDLGSLTGEFGRRAKALADKLLFEGLYSVASTDLHDAEGARRDLERWIHALGRSVGGPAVDVLLGENPRRLISGRPCLRLGGAV